jgi:hypothetical protein
MCRIIQQSIMTVNESKLGTTKQRKLTPATQLLIYPKSEIEGSEFVGRPVDQLKGEWRPN